jgi:chromosome segregation ATPase
MLSSEDKKAYLTLCARHRRVRRFIAQAEETLAAIESDWARHGAAAEKLRSEIQESFTDLTILNEYRDHKLLLHDTIERFNDTVNDKNKIKNFIKKLNKKLEATANIREAARKELRRHLKGRGKVLYLEGKRS